MANWASTTSAMGMKLNALLLSQEEKNIFNLSSAREIEKNKQKLSEKRHYSSSIATDLWPAVPLQV